MEPFSANQALQLLWTHYEQPEVKLRLTDKEIAHLKLEVIADWDNLTSPYKKFLITLDKLELISIMAHREHMFI